MDYKYTAEREDYSPYAAGGVFHSAPGFSAFPVRLAVELFRRCLALRKQQGTAGRAVVYDPCCGGAYHLATMAFFNWESIDRIYASDIDPNALAVAARNLALLSAAGMAGRIAGLEDLHRQWGKESHAAALRHAQALKQRLAELSAGHTVPTHLFCADATDGVSVRAGLDGTPVDIVLTDVPYGRQAQWRFAGETQPAEPLWRLLDALLPLLAPHAVVAVAASKQEKIRHEAYRRLQHVSIGKRQVTILGRVAG